MDIETKKKLWIALSEIYHDTEITEGALFSIAQTAKIENVSFKTLYRTNKEEVFPVLFKNLLSVAGVWTGFNQVWLVKKITKSINKNKWILKNSTQSNTSCFHPLYRHQ